MVGFVHLFGVGDRVPWRDGLPKPGDHQAEDHQQSLRQGVQGPHTNQGTEQVRDKYFALWRGAFLPNRFKPSYEHGHYQESLCNVISNVLYNYINQKELYVMKKVVDYKLSVFPLLIDFIETF